MGDATPYSDAELAELRALHEGLCDDTDCASQRLYATIDSLRATLATERVEGERLRAENERLERKGRDLMDAVVTAIGAYRFALRGWSKEAGDALHRAGQHMERVRASLDDSLAAAITRPSSPTEEA